jgi:hypothetical protein
MGRWEASVKQKSPQKTNRATAIEAINMADHVSAAPTKKSQAKGGSVSLVATPCTETSLTKTSPSQEATRAELIDKIRADMCRLAGVNSKDLAERISRQVRLLQVLEPSSDSPVEHLKIAMQTLGELQPKDLTQALLAVQMIGVHHAAISFLFRATAQGQTLDGADANVLRATRLMRLFTEQLEAMAKLKGKTGQQKVIVEHVHVHQGGQAIVGAVSADKGNDGEGEGQSDGT